MSDKSELYGQLKKALEDGTLKTDSWATLLTSPKDRWFFDTGKAREKLLVLDVALPVVESPLVESGYAYFIETGTRSVLMSRPMLEFEHSDDALNVLATLRYRIAQTFEEVLTQGDRPRTKWIRRHGESFRAWELRLFISSDLDNPEIRWAYTCALWREIWLFMKRVIKRD